ncbi:MAG: hypothetical protein K2L87_04195, partial [Clostridiales bacterium]|nr:hypothetical protein [Clostridiales bacterium]
KNVPITIAPREVTLTWGTTSFNFNGSVQCPTATAGNVISGDTVDVTVSGGQTNAGTYTATASGLSNNNYKLPESVEMAYVINKVDITLSITSTKAQYGKTLALTVSGNIGNAEITWSFAEETTLASITGDSLIPLGVGTVKVKAVAADTMNTNEATATATITIEKGTLELAFADISAMYSKDMLLEVTGNVEDSPVKYSISYGSGESDGAGTIDGATLHATKAGKVTLKARIEETSLFKAIEITLTDFEIAALPVSLEWAYPTFTYNGEMQVPVATVTNLVEGDSCTVTVNGESKAGTGLTATAVGVSNKNYTVVGGESITTTYDIAPKPIDIVWSNTNFPFTGTVQHPTATATGTVKNEECEIEVSGGQINAGTYVATAVGTKNSNYTLEGATNLTTSFTIDMAYLDNLDLETKTVNFGETLKLSVVGNIGTGDVSYSLSLIGGDDGKARLDGDTLIPEHVGKVLVTVAVAETMNTHAKTISVEVTIEKGNLTLSLETLEVLYGAELMLVATGNLEDGDVSFAVADGTDGGTATLKDDIFLVATHVGKVTVSITVADTVNYNGTTQTAEVTIKQLPVVLRWVVGEYTYNGAEQAPEAYVTNLVGEEDIEVTVKGATNVSTDGNDLEAIATALTGTNSENYTLANGENITMFFNIQPYAVTIDWEKDDFTYTGSAQARQAFAVDAFGTDSCPIDVEGAAIDAGTYDVKAVGTGNPNYVLKEADNLETTFTIKRADINPDFIRTETPYNTELFLELYGNLGSGKVTYSIDDSFSDYAEIGGDNGDVFIAKKVGKVTVTAVVDQTTNYNGATVSHQFTITFGERTIKLLTTETTYGTGLVLEIEGNGEGEDLGTVSYRVLSGPGTMMGDQLNPTGAGTVTVEITVGATTNFSKTVATGVVNVKALRIDLTWGTLEFTYDGREHTPEAFVGNLVGTDKCVVYVSGGRTNAGTYECAAYSLSNSNYTLSGLVNTTNTYTIGKASIDFDITSTRAYLGVDLPLTVSSYPGGGKVQYSIQNGTGRAQFADDDHTVLTPLSLGTVIVTATIPETENYIAAQDMKMVIIEKNKANIELLTKEAVYGTDLELRFAVNGQEANVEGGPQIHALFFTADITGMAFVTDNVLTPRQVGKVNVTITIPETAEYGVSTVTVELTIKPREITGLTWSNFEFTYNGKMQAPTATPTGLL